MAKKVSTAKKVTKKRVKKNVERGQAHIQSSFNNTIVTLTENAVFERLSRRYVRGVLYIIHCRWLLWGTIAASFGLLDRKSVV